jgi:hypothetical protein
VPSLGSSRLDKRKVPHLHAPETDSKSFRSRLILVRRQICSSLMAWLRAASRCTALQTSEPRNVHATQQCTRSCPCKFGYWPPIYWPPNTCQNAQTTITPNFKLRCLLTLRCPRRSLVQDGNSASSGSTLSTQLCQSAVLYLMRTLSKMLPLLSVPESLWFLKPLRKARPRVLGMLSIPAR